MSNPNLITLQAAKVSQLLEGESIDSLSTVVGKCFVISGMGLSVTEGKKPSKEAYEKGIAYLSEIPNMLENVAVRSSFYLGDMILSCRKSFGDEAADTLIASVCRAQSKVEHTIREAERISKKMPLEERVVGLSHTHHALLIDAKRGLSTEKYQEFSDWLRKGDVLDVETTQGESDQISTPHSIRNGRDRLQELKTGSINVESTLIDPTGREDRLADALKEIIATRSTKELAHGYLRFGVVKRMLGEDYGAIMGILERADFEEILDREILRG